MTTKVKAVKSTMSFGIIIIQFVIGLHILGDIFSSNKIVDGILSGWSNLSMNQGRGSMVFDTTQIEAPIRFLFVVLGFMIFSYVLIMFAPTLTGRKQRTEFDYE